MIENPHAWMEEALCRGEEIRLFFGGPEIERHGKQICRSCNQVSACLDYALEQPEQNGVYGGLSAEEREGIKDRRRRVGI